MNLELIVNSTALLCAEHGYAAAGTPQEKETLDSSSVARAQWRWSRSLPAHRYTHTEAEQLQAAPVGTHHCTVLQELGWARIQRAAQLYTTTCTNPAHSGACFALLWGGGLLLNFPLFLESTAATPFHCQHLAPDKSQMIFILTETRFLLTLQFYTKST